MEARELHLKDYLRVVRKRKYTVCTVFVLVVATVTLVTLSTTPLYPGQVQLLIEKAEPSSLTGGYRWYSPYDPEFYETQYQLIRSLSVAKRVVTALSLDTSDFFAPEAEQGRSRILAAALAWVHEAAAATRELLGVRKAGDAKAVGGAGDGPEEPDRTEAIAERIRAEITVRPVRDSRIVEIGYLSPNPQLAASIANAVANAYIDETLEIRLSGARRTVHWMSKKADEERKKLERSEKALQQYMKANDIVTLEDRLTVTPQKLADISTHLVKAEAKRKELEVLYRKTGELMKEPGKIETLPAVASDAAIGALRGEILRAEQRVVELSRKYGPKHPVMVQAMEDLEVLRRKRKQEVHRVIASIKTEYEMAQANEREFRGLLEDTKKQASGLNEKLIQYGMLKREAEANRQLYDALTKKLKEQSVTEDTRSVNVWIVDEAKPETRPVKPRTRTNLLLGVLGGLFAGLAAAFFVEHLDDSVKAPDETEMALGVPVLGVVSNVRGRRRKIEEALLNGSLPHVAEEYKTLRTAVMLSSAAGPPKTVVVTSSTPEEGKTTTALNLALSIAQSNRRVVLVDADLRKPRIHRTLGLQNAAGLSTCLADSGGLEALQQGPLPHLKVLTAGPVPPNPSELLSSGRMEELVAALARQADAVVFDSPPVLSVSDARILARLSDGAVLVTRTKKVSYDTVRAGLKLLRDLDARVLGIVLNRFEPRRSGYEYYRYASYYSRSRERDA